MRAADVLRELGRPIAYYPFLSRYLGGVNASVLFCQIFYWQDKAASDLGVHKTVEELEEETGLSYEEQRSARRSLRAKGVLIETAKRIEHKTYFRIDEDALELLLSSDPVTKKQGSKSAGTKSEKSISRNGKSPSREMGKVHPAKSGNPDSRDGQTLARGSADPHSVNSTETTTETTAATRATDAVDKSVAAAAENEKPNPEPERELTDLLISLERARGKDLSIDRSRDRVHVLTWVGKGITPQRLREAHALAVAARGRDGDDRPTYAGFVTTFIDAEAAPAAVGQPDMAEWFRSPEGVDAHGAECGMRERKADEDWRYYRVLVARAARDTAAVEFVLSDAQRFNAADLYQFARVTFGDALMPVDDYAS
ncbi:hypothetical protein B0G76_2867 [Paraburkholderia sp. BL23I1N1]|uniref:hypothetical protein n=1 Tax=Paraburkholderia sp. BL23I1N1 TaxID=1938802 RepID=UPI000E7402B9|nr:hypothetical protein [Paraburkholderia sp. BL23I1N1]RKE36665.1 hypothetical protein B0G76_2867 [Paraburkholderia sp. BL23I1N1]